MISVYVKLVVQLALLLWGCHTVLSALYIVPQVITHGPQAPLTSTTHTAFQTFARYTLHCPSPILSPSPCIHIPSTFHSSRTRVSNPCSLVAPSRGLDILLFSFRPLACPSLPPYFPSHEPLGPHNESYETGNDIDLATESTVYCYRAPSKHHKYQNSTFSPFDRNPLRNIRRPYPTGREH